MVLLCSAALPASLEISFRETFSMHSSFIIVPTYRCASLSLNEIKPLQESMVGLQIGVGREFTQISKSEHKETDVLPHNYIPTSTSLGEISPFNNTKWAIK